MARPLRRPVKLSEMFPDARLQEVTDLLGPDNPNLRSLKEMVAEERYRERHRAELDKEGGWGRPTGAPSDALSDSISGG
ncbi:MAG TPA: hypothetical protein VGM98_16770, partial [Schlesneria sp.]